MKKNTVIACVLSIFLALGIGFAGSSVTISEIPTWYATLTKPMLNPPAWVFGPVWMLLYILMGVASGTVWQYKKKKTAQVFLGIYGISLIANFLWSYVFFGLHLLGHAVVIVVALWLLILALIAVSWKFHRLSAYLLIPYLLWVSFASYLNIQIYLLN